MDRKDLIALTGGVAVGTIGAHAVYRGIGGIFTFGGKYLPAIAELVLGVGILFAGRKSLFFAGLGAAMASQGILDLVYAGNLMAVEL